MKIKHLYLSAGIPSNNKLFIMRQAVAKDAPRIISVAEGVENFQMSEYSRGIDKEELLFWISNPSAIVVVVSSKSDLIGYGYGHCLSKKWFYFDEFAVSPDFRNMGVGKEMYKFLREECRARGFHVIQGIVKESQVDSLGYWTKLGFVHGSKCTWVEDWIDEE